jgi:hypothetical protein
MSTLNKTTSLVCVDYADKPMNRNIRRCRFIAHTADSSALIGINPKNSPSTFVGARVAKGGWVGLYGRPRGWDGTRAHL